MAKCTRCGLYYDLVFEVEGQCDACLRRDRETQDMYLPTFTQAARIKIEQRREKGEPT